MAEKKKGKKRREEYVVPGEEVGVKPTKDEYTIAKWLRKNVPIKKTKFLNHNVEYFTGSKAIDGLLESKFARGDDALFKSRENIVDYLHLMLVHKFFHRARKVPVSEQELKGRKKDKKSMESSDEKKKDEKDKREKGTDPESSVLEGKESTADKEKRKRKVRLEMHNDQQFVDGLDAYVWIYDPIPFHYWIFGTLLVLGAIGICLFPLWPPSVRLGVYYISLAAAGFLVLIILLVVLRLILFCLVWLLTLGKHHIWILPNLTEDVGFFASFWPLYKYEYKGSDNSNTSTNKKDKKTKKEKLSDVEGEVEKVIKKEGDNADSTIRHRQVAKQNLSEDEKQSENGRNVDGSGGLLVVGGSESESETSQRSSTGRDFEIVDQDDLES